MKNINQIILLFGCVLLVLKPFASTAQYVYTDANLQKQLNEARDNVYNENFGDAVAKYAVLVKNNDNKTVSAEYAYVLALSGCYDGAIMNLDKVVASGQVDKDVLFYIAQVLKLMDYDAVADIFWKFGGDDISWTVQGRNKTYPPNWISGKYRSFVDKYKYRASINTDDFGTALRRANKLAERHQYIQSMVLFLELIDIYPDEYLPYIGLTALLENIGYKKTASEFLQSGIEKMGKDRMRIDPSGVYEKHLKELLLSNTDDKSPKIQSNKNSTMDNTKKSRSFTHYGLSYINKALSINSKFGYYVGETSFLSLGWAYTYAESTFYTIDLSFCISTLMILGIDVSAQWSNGDFSYGLGPCMGFSIPFGRRTSFDILGVLNMNSQEESIGKMSASVGITHYF